MGNSYSIYRFSYHIFSDSTILPMNCQKNIIQQSLVVPSLLPDQGDYNSNPTHQSVCTTHPIVFWLSLLQVFLIVYPLVIQLKRKAAHLMTGF